MFENYRKYAGGAFCGCNQVVCIQGAGTRETLRCGWQKSLRTFLFALLSLAFTAVISDVHVVLRSFVPSNTCWYVSERAAASTCNADKSLVVLACYDSLAVGDAPSLLIATVFASRWQMFGQILAVFIVSYDHNLTIFHGPPSPSFFLNLCKCNFKDLLCFWHTVYRY